MATPLGQYALLDSNNLKGLFNSMYEAEIAGNWAPTIGNLITSDSASETYGWLGAAPSLDELTGDMTEDQLSKFSYTLKNVEYAKAIKIAEKDLRRDKLGQIEMRIGEMAQKAQDHWNSLASTLIINGNSSGYTSYDGAKFFDTTHAESGTNQVNALTNSHVAALDITTATAPTATEAAAAVTGVLGKFYELTDDKGDPINGSAKDFVVMVGTAALWAPLNQAIYGQALGAGVGDRVQALTGRNGITIDLVLNPRLSAKTTQMYMFRRDSVVKPFILQEEVGVTPKVSTRDNDEYIKYNRFLFSVYTSRAAGYGRWQSAMMATFS